MGGVIPVGAANGQGVYGHFLSALDAEIANGSGLEAFNVSHWANYVVSSAEQSGASRYIITVPGYLPNGRYFCMPYLQLSFPGLPAAGDTPLDILFFDWKDGNVLGFGSATNVGSINGSVQAAVNLGISANNFVNGMAAAGTLTTTRMTTNLPGAQDNLYTGRVLYFTSGANAGKAALITAYSVTGGRLTFVGYNNSPIAVAPSAGDTFQIA